MASWAIYYVDDDGMREYVESFSEAKDAYAERDRLMESITEDEEEDGIRVIVLEEL